MLKKRGTDRRQCARRKRQVGTLSDWEGYDGRTDERRKTDRRRSEMIKTTE